MAEMTFHDYQPTALSLHDAVVEGLSRANKQIPPKFFYDERGSHLFEQICEQPEYYPPTVERAMLKQLAPELARLSGTDRVLIEPGAGSSAKVRLLLDHLRPSAYVPMDISADFLKHSAAQLAEEYPWLPVHAACVDFTHSLPLPDAVPDGPRLVFFPGSSLGNFDRAEAAAFLRLVHETLGPNGQLLIGVDTKKPRQLLDAAYNDAAGVTAEFNLNLLDRMQRELQMQIDREGFCHHAFYNEQAGRVEMHLISQRDQQLRLNGYRFELQAGESVHTENSYKYAPQEFLALASECGFVPLRHWEQEQQLFAIYLLEAHSGD